MNATARLWLSHLAVALRALRRDAVGSAINIVGLALGCKNACSVKLFELNRRGWVPTLLTG